MRLKLTSGLPYPITVTQLLKQPSSNVARNETIFKYTYQETRLYDDIDDENDGEPIKKVETIPGRFEAASEGELQRWMIREHQTINQPVDVAELKEVCAHEMQFAGTCVECGKDMTILDGYNAVQKGTARAAVNMVHDNNLLKVSSAMAVRAENEAKRRLVNAKKLSLVVDLDMTVIHATVDPTVAEWQHDSSNPNYESVKDVQAFRLRDNPPATTETTYYIKMRPGLQHFFEQVARLYELHIYTMGTRAYAEAVAKIIDPKKKYFGSRILSRDESGSMTAKNLQRLFPVDQKMVVIIDDRSDVWRWSDNLIRVSPFDFFTGSGDINASFLPPKPKVQSTPASEKPVTGLNANGSAHGTANGDANGGDSSLQGLLEMSAGDDEKELKDKTEKAAQTIEKQVKERPLAQKQLALDQKEESESQTSSDSESNPDKNNRQSVLDTSDQELMYLEDALRNVHGEFFRQHAQNIADLDAGHLGSLRLEASEDRDLAVLPNIQMVMSEIKLQVLEGCSAVFSGVVPLNLPLRKADLCIWAEKFGLKVREQLRRSTTHVIAVRKGTAKVKMALRAGKGKIKVVNTQWLMDSMLRWKKQDEVAYMLHGEDDFVKPIDSRAGVEEDEAGVLSDSEDPLEDNLTDGDTTDAERTKPKPLKLRTKKRLEELELEPDTDEEYLPDSPFDDKSPIGGDENDWEGMDDELAEFMGESGDDNGKDDDDNDSVASERVDAQPDGARTPSGRKAGKRRRDEADADGEKEESPRKRMRDDDGPEKQDEQGIEREKEEDDEEEEADWDALWDEDAEEEKQQQQKAEGSQPADLQKDVTTEPALTAAS